MDFTKRLKSFISDIKESAVKSPDEETLPALLVESPAVAKFKEHLVEGDSDPTKEAEVLSSIDEHYYQGAEFDSSQYELEKLPQQAQLMEIDKERKTMKRQLAAVSRRVSELVLENHSAYAAELQRVMELQANLQQAHVICANGRRKLGEAEEVFTVAGLGLMSNYRKRQQVIGLLKALSTIKTLQRTDVRLREMVEEEDYAGAIQLCLECQHVAATLKHYHCISELSTKLADTLEQIEESLDVALSKTCLHFDPVHYTKLQAAYQLLSKTQTAMDQLHMHFTSAIHNTAFQIVLGYVELFSGTADSKFQKKNYADLCKNISGEVFTACLLDLCKALWGVMRSYHHTMAWHETQLAQEGCSGEEEASVGRQYVRQKLTHGLVRVWGDVQAKVKVYLLSTDLSHFQYDQFIQVLDIINRLMQVGEEFCGSKSEGLEESLRKQSLAYFRHYHRARLDELRMFLENEAWELCPVRANFSVMLLQEFKFLRSGVLRSRQQDSFHTTGGDADDKIKHGFFQKYAEEGTPFDVQTDDDQTEDLFETNGEEHGSGRLLSQDSDSDDDVADELKQDYVDEQTGDSPVRNKLPVFQRHKSKDRSIPIVTNTTINVCRVFGKYMQMMTVLTPIAFDVTICMSQLFDYYLYTVYSFFIAAESEPEVYMNGLSNKLRGTLKRIRDNMIIAEIDDTGPPPPDKILQPSLSPMVNLAGREGMHGLAERVVATESLVFLAQQFELLHNHLEALIPTAKKAFLQQFFSQTIATAGELRGPVYHTVTSRSVSTQGMLQLMTQVRFDIRDIMSQHSPYVDAILQELSSFSTRVEHVSRRVPVPQPVTDVIWQNCASIVNQTFVEGYAGTKKCSNEGRALMQLDFQQYLLKLETLTSLRPIPGREYVEGYIKAFYLPEAQLESWLRDHKEYSHRELTALIGVVPHLNKKTRQRLTLMLEDMERTRKRVVEIVNVSS